MNALIKTFPGLNPLVRRFPGLYQAARRQLEKFEDMDFAQRQTYQRRRLRAVLRAAGHSPDAKLEDLPFMQKSDVRANPAQYRHRNILPISHAMTSGTNGEPLNVQRSFRSVVFEQAAIDWVVRQAGYDFANDRVAVLRASPVTGVSRGDTAGITLEGGRMLTLPTNDLSPETFPAFLDALQSLRPQIFYVMPTPAEYLADLMIERGITLEIPLVFSSSEMLTATARQKFRTAFNAETIDYYGQAERVSAAFAIKPGEYRFIGASALTELVRSGESWEIVGTGLHNLSQVLIRYRTGDLLQDNLDEADVLPVTLGLKAFGGIEGRSGDELIGNDGRKLIAIHHIPRTLDNYGRFQFVQDRPNAVIIQMAGWSPQVKGHSDPVLKRARLMLPEEFEVDVRFVDRLERTASGKTPFIIRRF